MTGPDTFRLEWEAAPLVGYDSATMGRTSREKSVAEVTGEKMWLS
jgi:hypothetical protein